MSREKFETIFMGIVLVILGFLIYDMMEKQKQQTAKLRALRKKLDNTKGFEEDTQQLRNDWLNIRKDLEIASNKTLTNVIQTA